METRELLELLKKKIEREESRQRVFVVFEGGGDSETWSLTEIFYKKKDAEKHIKKLKAEHGNKYHYDILNRVVR